MNLLRITTQDAKIEMNSKRAQLKMENPGPSYTVNTTPSKLNIEQNHIKVKMDGFDQRVSMGRHTAFTLTAEKAEEGKQAALEATANYAEVGNQMAQIHKGASIADIVGQKFMGELKSLELIFTPSVPTDISWEPNSIKMSYEPSKQEFDWETMKLSMEYIPGNLTINMVQYPSVTIEYLGGPVYVPESADPNLER